MPREKIDAALALGGFTVLSAYMLIYTGDTMALALMPVIVIAAILVKKPQIAYLLPLCFALSLIAKPRAMNLENISAYMLLGVIPLLLATQGLASYATSRRIAINRAGTFAALLPLPAVGLLLAWNGKNFLGTSAESVSAAGLLCLLSVIAACIALIAHMETRQNRK